MTEQQNPENDFKQTKKKRKEEMWYLMHKVSVLKKT